MNALAQDIQARLSAAGIPALVQERRTLDGERARLEQELAAVRELIPFFDRLWFFSTTEEQRQEDELEEALSALEGQLEALDEKIQPALEQLAADSPPFALGLLIHRAIRGARGQRGVSGWLSSDPLQERLEQALDEAIALIEAHWPVDDPEPLLAQLSDEQRCRELATVMAPAPSSHPELGLPVIDPGRYSGVMARRLLDSGFFAGQREVQQLEEQLSALRTEAEAAEDAVPLIDRINFFTTTAEERERDRLAEEAAALTLRVEDQRELLREHLHRALASYPPLALRQALLAARGALGQLDKLTILQLGQDGTLARRDGVGGRVLVLAALRHLGSLFAAFFEGLPRPFDVHAEPQPGAARGPRQEALQRTLRRFDHDRVAALRNRVGGHALMLQLLFQARQRVQGRISLFDRFVFWSDTEDEQAEDELDRRIAWHHKRRAAVYQQLVEAARHSARQEPLFLLQQLAIEAHQTLEAIHTDAGSSSFPKNCRVYKREECRAALAGIRQCLGRNFHLKGSRRSFMRDLAELLESGSALPPAPAKVAGLGGVAALRSYRQAVVLVAHELVGSEFPELLRRVMRNEKLAQELRGREGEVAENISFWDRVNVFTTTDEERERAELRSEQRELGEQLSADLARLQELLTSAMQVYPPAQLYYWLHATEWAVGQIRAVCRRYTVSRGSGKNRRTETRYRCELIGKGRARDQLVQWCTRYVHLFGQVPDPTTLLSLWEGSRLADRGWE